MRSTRYSAWCCFAMAGLAAGAGQTSARPDLVAKVATGELKEARASWWGFEAADSTKFLQAALDSGAETVVIDRQATPWIVCPLEVRSNTMVVFEKGTVLEAKRGAYLGRGDQLVSLRGVTNVVLPGYGATLRMHRDDYLKPPYAFSHAPAVGECGVKLCAEF